MTSLGMKNDTARNAAWVTLGEGSRIAAQAAVLVVLARRMAPKPFGTVVGVTALLQLVAPFATLGAPMVLFRKRARSELDHSDAWGMALMMALGGAAVASIPILVLAGSLTPGVPLHALVALAATELVLVTISDMSAIVGAAEDAFAWAFGIRAVASACRGGAAGAFWLSGGTNAEAWAACYLVSMSIAALYAVTTVASRLGPPSRRRPERSDLRDGVIFSASLGAFAVQDNADKPLLVAYGFPAAAGTYGIGYRMVIMTMLPVRAVLAASLRRFFMIGKHDPEETIRHAGRLAVGNVIYGVLVGIALFTAAPLVRVVFGNQHGEVVSVIRWLALLPLIRVVEYFLSDVLTGINLHAARFRCLALGASLNVAFNLLLIPRYSWRGAVVATYASEVILTAAVYTALRSSRRHRRPVVEGSSTS
jgi:O-antigen/teichoic acid export membrane protein